MESVKRDKRNLLPFFHTLQMEKKNRTNPLNEVLDLKIFQVPRTKFSPNGICRYALVPISY